MTRTLVVVLGLCGVFACSRTEPADLLLVNGHVYTLSWSEPDVEGRPANDAPYSTAGWRPDADAIVVRGDRIVFVGSREGADRLHGERTEVLDLHAATVLPGLIESHVHVENLGASLERVNLVGVRTEAVAVDRVAARAASVPKGDWIIGWGWDEGAWASKYPDMTLLSVRVPDHPVLLHGLHSFASWGNRLAFERAGITKSTPSPEGGEIRRDARGNPTGILLNNATRLVERAVPPPTSAQLESRILAGLDALARAGYVTAQEAGADTAVMAALERLAAAKRLPITVHAMLAARDPAVLDAWEKRGPDTDDGDSLVVRSVKAFYDGAMGSRGAFFLEDYSDRPGHRGVGGAAYGFDAERMKAMAKAGFQPIVHAIGDRANRETLDLMALTGKDLRPRIEHAQVVSAADMPRFASLGVIASMQPSHAVEDMRWAETRIGPDRIKGAYAWRSLRRAGARLAFNSDLPATDYSIFYGLHSAVTRQDRGGQPPGGWQPGEKVTIEEAIRGWTTWAAHALFDDTQSGVVAVGRRADLTILDIDPFQVNAELLLQGHVVATIARGKQIYERGSKRTSAGSPNVVD